MPNEHTPLLEGNSDGFEHRPPQEHDHDHDHDHDHEHEHGHEHEHEHGHEYDWSSDPHAQFCILVGVPPSLPLDDRDPRFRDLNHTVPRKSLYGRATRHLADQRFHYYSTAALSNVLLLSQVVLGAALTALGASASSHVLITLFGAANTIIAGLVAYLKSRGQPMRARMFLDDLERVVGEIENSEIMWLGIAHHANGYDDLAAAASADERGVTVRSEVARLTRLYDRAVRSNSASYPDMYGQPSSDASRSVSRTRPQPGTGPGLPAAPLPAVPLIISPTSPGPMTVATPRVFGSVAEEAEPATAASTPILISTPRRTPPLPPPRHESKRGGYVDVMSLDYDQDRGVRKSSSALELSARKGDSLSIGSASADFTGMAQSFPGSRHVPI